MQKPTDGYGRWNFVENGPNEVYDGHWKNGLMHGKGVYRFQNGSIFDGEFFNNQQHGKGKLVQENGDTYEGEWQCGQRHGSGKVTYANGTTHEGGFSCGFMHGLATLAYTEDGNPANSELDYSWSAGDKMVCHIKKNIRHGACTYTFFNGETFSCTWVDGRCPEFSARQRLVLEHPDEASIKARAAGHATVAAFEAFKKQAADASVLAVARDAMLNAVEQTMACSAFFAECCPRSYRAP